MRFVGAKMSKKPSRPKSKANFFNHYVEQPRSLEQYLFCVINCVVLIMLQTPMHTVYIIYSPTTDKYFIGQSKDLKITLWQHNAKTNPATAEGKPWEVKFTQAFATRNEALSLEMKLKKKNRAHWEELISSTQPTI